MDLQASLERALVVSSIVAVCACGATTNDAQSATPLATATPDEPGQVDESATLEILAVPPASVLVDGKPAGKTPISGYRVPPGSHDVTFVDDTGPRTMTVKLAPGEARVVKSDRAPGIIEKKR